MRVPLAARGQLIVVMAALGAAATLALLVGGCACTASCSAPVAPRPAGRPRVVGQSPRPRGRTPSEPARGRSGASASDTARPAAAGPSPSHTPVVIAVARQWLGALGRWQAARSPAATAELRALSTPALWRGPLLTGPAREPSSWAFGPRASPGRTQALQAYLRPGGWTVIATRRFGSDVLAVELTLSPTPVGPRVSSYEP